MSDFFRINMPYGMVRNSQGEWMFFNREYMPIGLRKISVDSDDKFVEENQERFYHNYKGVTEKFLLSVMETCGNREHCDRNEKGEIIRVWFYWGGDTEVTGKIDSIKWQDYTDRLKKLYKLYPID